MATTSGSAAVDLTSKPWAYVAIPLSIVVGLALITVLLHSRRRHRLAKLGPVRTNPHTRRAAERDLQEAWQRGAPGQPRRRGFVMRRWSHRSGRWAWVHPFLAIRGEEGLNEYGEAPPPYDGLRREGSHKVEEESIGEDVEMQVRPSGSRTGEGGGSGETRAAGSRVDNEDSSRQLQARTEMPPAYGEPQARDDTAVRTSTNGDRGRPPIVAQPPPVVLPGSQPT